MGFPTRSDTNRAVQPQKIARGLKFRIKIEEELTICVAKTKALISFVVIAKLICVFVFHICKKPVFSRRGLHKHVNVTGSCFVVGGLSLSQAPYCHCEMPDFIKDTDHLEALQEELKDLEFVQKNNDLYKFLQVLLRCNQFQR